MTLAGKNLVVALVVLAVASVMAENIVLVRRTSKLEAMLVSERQVPALSVGDVVPEVALKDLNGQAVELNTEQPKILFIFSSNCPYCRKNFANWKSIEQRVGKSNVVYLSTDRAETLKPFACEHEIADNTLVLTAAQATAIKSFRIPETIQVSRGRVAGIIIGVLTPSQTAQVRLIN